MYIVGKFWFKGICQTWYESIIVWINGSKDVFINKINFEYVVILMSVSFGLLQFISLDYTVLITTCIYIGIYTINSGYLDDFYEIFVTISTFEQFLYLRIGLQLLGLDR